jgi:ferric-dicitrate binding protein FerR (iron transport regulator)
VIAAIALRGSGARDPETRAFAALSDTTGTTYEAARGTFEDLSLPDSSKARLGAGASLGANAEFGNSARALRIAGPVELRLLSDSAKLVAIQAGEHRFLTAGAVAAFSISTGGQIAVQVDSGALVLVRDSARVRLVAGSIVRVDTGTPASLSRDERDQAFGWRKGRLQLVGQPLSAIAASAKQWYDVDVQFPSGRAATDTASLDVPLAERDSLVLGLERALRATASVSGDRIVLQASSTGAVSPRPVRRALPAPPALSLPGLPPLD